MSSQPLFATTTSSHRLNSATQGHTYKVPCSITSHVDEATQRTFAAPFLVAHPQLALPPKQLPSPT